MGMFENILSKKKEETPLASGRKRVVFEKEEKPAVEDEIMEPVKQEVTDQDILERPVSQSSSDVGRSSDYLKDKSWNPKGSEGHKGMTRQERIKRARRGESQRKETENWSEEGADQAA